MNQELFTYIWQYTIHQGMESEFLAAYLLDGEWARLFRKDTNYIKTELLQSKSDNSQYLTIDYWQSELARDAFRAKYAQEFEALDKKCEAFTKKESLIGDFAVLGSTSAPATES